MKLILGDIYYRIESRLNNSSGTSKKSSKGVFIRGNRLLHDKEGDLTMLCNNILEPKRSQRRLWSDGDHGTAWIHLGPGEIEDYPEALL